MARIRSAIRVDTSGMAPILASIESLGEAMAVAQFDGPIPLEMSPDGLCHGEHLIASIKLGPIVDWVAHLKAAPTFRMPLFAAEICRLVPGVKVRWNGGWPLFSASDGDDEFEPDPVMPLGELV